MFCHGWSAPRPGRDPDENQDAYEVRWVHGEAGTDGMLLAVSDGASSTEYAGPWARALVAAAELDWPTLDDGALTARLDAARERFRLGYPADPPWYVAHKLAKEGSQAALVVVSFQSGRGADEVLVTAVAVGDCALIVFRGDGSTASYPVSGSAGFGISPRLISTKPQPALQYDRWTASLKPGDVAVVCTDAVGKWTLQGVESGDRNSLFRVLLDLLGEERAPEPGAPAADSGLFARLTAGTGPQRLPEDDVTVVLGIPIRPGRTRNPDDLARAVLERQLSGDTGRANTWSAWLAAAIAGARRALTGGGRT
jgi:hypothetical protein